MSPLSKKILVIHLGLLLAQLICFSAFALELDRALSGNRLSWAYVFEWPIFAAYAVYVWKKLINEEKNGPQSPPRSSTDVDDPSLDAYNDYLRKVHDERPSKGPTTQ